MQHRIQGPRAQVVAVLAQLFDHAKAEDRAFARVMEQMNPYQSRQEVLITGCPLVDYFQHECISKADIEVRYENPTKLGLCQLQLSTRPAANPYSGAPARLSENS